MKTGDGGYALAGEKGGNNWWLIKVNSSGDKQWERTYGGAGFGWCGVSVVETNNGRYALACGTNSMGAGMLDFWLIKTAPVGIIYIRADGSVDPPTVPIQRNGDLYTFTDNITASIVVEKDDVVLDGAGYKLQGPGGISKGIDLLGRNNVTIRNIVITGFWNGIWLNMSSNNNISGNIIKNIVFYAIVLNVSSGNNNLADGVVKIHFGGDVDGDGFIGGYDATMIGIHWWSPSVGNPNYSPDADFNEDGFVGGYDATLIGINWWTSVPKP